jgi:hypothetical protein
MMIVESIVDVAVIVLFVVLLFPVFENEAPTQFDNDVVGSFIRRPENIAFCSAVDFVATLGLYPDPAVSVELPAGSDKPEPGSKSQRFAFSKIWQCSRLRIKLRLVVSP